ncbi:MAG: ribosome maturation factor RimP [Ruminococcaceae bacterium]|nr:ribosome maturation factor RimP [Oscillospiraceae bacterium]
MPLALSAAKQLGAEVYDIEYKKEGKDYYLRIFIDKDGGVGINDCENYSRLISPMLDSEDPIKDNYILEVSSPGMFRKLNTEKHFEKYIGSRVEVKLYKSENGKKSVTGTLKGYANGTVTVLTDDAGEKEIEKEKYMYVRLYPDIF